MRHLESHLRHLQQGDLQGFRRLFDHYHQTVFSFALRLVKDREVAEEISSDVFIKLWNKRKDIKTEGCLDRLLLTITKGLAIDHLRKVARQAKSRELYWLHCQTEHTPEQNEEVFEQNLAAVQQAIKSLPPKRRKVFELRYKEELSYQQIAQVLDVSPNTVKVHLNKATKHLRQQLEINYHLGLAIIVAATSL